MYKFKHVRKVSHPTETSEDDVYPNEMNEYILIIILLSLFV